MVLANLVLTVVSSIKLIRVSMLAMKEWRRVIQMWRAAETTGRFCSTACRSFFARQPQVPLLRDPAGHPVPQESQSTIPAAIALSLWRDAARFLSST